MPDINRVVIIGRLGAEPKLRYTASGLAVVSFSVATESRHKEGNDWVGNTTWVRCTAWRDQAEKIAGSFTGGTTVYLEGHLNNRSWTNSDGEEIKFTEIVVQRIAELIWPQITSQAQGESVGEPAPPTSDDELPF